MFATAVRILADGCNLQAKQLTYINARVSKGFILQVKKLKIKKKH